VTVRAVGPDADYIITADYDEALRTYRDWLTDYAARTGDPAAQEHLERLAGAAAQLHGRAIRYSSARSGRTTQTGQTSQVFALSARARPRIWKLPPPTGIDRDWGRTVHRLTVPRGAHELRTDDSGQWRIFWLDTRSPCAFATSDAYDVAAEAAADLALLDTARPTARARAPYAGTIGRRRG
jgi:hypothetical protein